MTAVPETPSANVSRRVVLSNAQRATVPGAELIALLTELSEDGIVTREELARLRAWLEVERGVDFAACGFLYEVIDTISSDDDITEDELDTLAQAIERVLPPDIRKQAAERRKQVRIARREALQAARQAEQDAAREERERARPLHRGDFIVAGAMRSEERREACDGLVVAERVLLEREPDNRHDGNAILIFTQSGDEMGYVPREDAAVMAPLMDAGGWTDATVKKLLETQRGHALPVIVSTMYRQDVKRPESTRRVSAPVRDTRPRPVLPSRAPTPAPSQSGSRWYWLLAVVLLGLILAGWLAS